MTLFICISELYSIWMSFHIHLIFDRIQLGRSLSYISSIWPSIMSYTIKCMIKACTLSYSFVRYHFNRFSFQHYIFMRNYLRMDTQNSKYYILCDGLLAHKFHLLFTIFIICVIYKRIKYNSKQNKDNYICFDFTNIENMQEMYKIVHKYLQLSLYRKTDLYFLQ